MLSKKEPVLEDMENSQPMQMACPGNKAKDVAEPPFTMVIGM